MCDNYSINASYPHSAEILRFDFPHRYRLKYVGDKIWLKLVDLKSSEVQQFGCSKDFMKDYKDIDRIVAIKFEEMDTIDTLKSRLLKKFRNSSWAKDRDNKNIIIGYYCECLGSSSSCRFAVDCKDLNYDELSSMKANNRFRELKNSNIKTSWQSPDEYEDSGLRLSSFNAHYINSKLGNRMQNSSPIIGSQMMENSRKSRQGFQKALIPHEPLENDYVDDFDFKLETARDDSNSDKQINHELRGHKVIFRSNDLVSVVLHCYFGGIQRIKDSLIVFFNDGDFSTESTLTDYSFSDYEAAPRQNDNSIQYILNHDLESNIEYDLHTQMPYEHKISSVKESFDCLDIENQMKDIKIPPQFQKNSQSETNRKAIVLLPKQKKSSSNSILPTDPHEKASNVKTTSKIANEVPRNDTNNKERHNFSDSLPIDQLSCLTLQPSDNPRDKVFPKIKILIVEDNIINQIILSSFLKKNNITYEVANNGLEAMVKWRQGDFHLILMDLELPQMSGLEAAKEIRNLEKLNGISTFKKSEPPLQKDSNLVLDRSKFKSPVIIVALTACSAHADRKEALLSGCNDYLTKPVNLHWLGKKITEWGCMQALFDFNGWMKGETRMNDNVSLTSGISS